MGAFVLIRLSIFFALKFGFFCSGFVLLIGLDKKRRRIRMCERNDTPAGESPAGNHLYAKFKKQLLER